MQWHPDQYKGEDKKKAEKMFIDVAAAKEVLTDPGEWRQIINTIVGEGWSVLSSPRINDMTLRKR